MIESSNSKFKDKESQKSIRVVLPLTLYTKMKAECQDHGEISRLIRKLLIKYLSNLEPQNGG